MKQKSQLTHKQNQCRTRDPPQKAQQARGGGGGGGGEGEKAQNRANKR